MTVCRGTLMYGNSSDYEKQNKTDEELTEYKLTKYDIPWASGCQMSNNEYVKSTYSTQRGKGKEDGREIRDAAIWKQTSKKQYTAGDNWRGWLRTWWNRVYGQEGRCTDVGPNVDVRIGLWV